MHVLVFDFIALVTISGAVVSFFLCSVPCFSAIFQCNRFNYLKLFLIGEGYRCKHNSLVGDKSILAFKASLQFSLWYTKKECHIYTTLFLLTLEFLNWHSLRCVVNDHNISVMLNMRSVIIGFWYSVVYSLMLDQYSAGVCPVSFLKAL